MDKLTKKFFDRDACLVAKELLGKVLCKTYNNTWLTMQITATEAYYKEEKGSHASLGLTPSRRALFMEAGTIYMYYARGGDSLNVSTKGEGNAVLIKAAAPWGKEISMLETMQTLNPIKNSGKLRKFSKLGSGQTLLCKSLALKVREWNGKDFTDEFFIADVGFFPPAIQVSKRKGIPIGRDEHLLYHFSYLLVGEKN